MNTSARRESLIGAVALLTVCAFFMVARWAKLESLWGDPGRWLFEAYRSAAGEVVYRDFAWQFPPLSLLLMSSAFRVFGATFETAQIVLDGLGVIVVLLAWRLARQVLSPTLAFATAIALTVALGTGIGPDVFLFSLQLYTPAQLTGLIGLLLLLSVAVEYLQSGVMTRVGWIALSLGSTIGLLSKPEFALGSLVCLAAWIVVDRALWFHDRPIGAWLRRAAALLVLGIVPAAIGYAVVGSMVGFDNLMAGLAGYGAAAFICPWWPTGISAFGVWVALGMGAMWIATLSAVCFNELRRRYERRYFAVWILAAFGLVLAVMYLPAQLRQNGFSQITPDDLVRLLIAPGAILLPMLWWSIVAWGRDAVRVIRALRQHTQLPIDLAVLFVIVAVAIALSARGLFGDQNTITPLVTIAAMPILFVVWPRWLLNSLSVFEITPVERSAEGWARVVLIVVLVYSAAKLIGWWWLDGSRPYRPLMTEAGTVYLGDQASARVYDFIRANSEPNEVVLDVNYGGGVNFASRRGSPVFSTQWWYLAPPQKYADEDLRRFQQRPARWVIGNKLDDFGASYGLITATRCTFPRLVWRPDELAYDPSRTYPLLDFILAHYRSIVEFRGVVILAPVE